MSIKPTKGPLGKASLLRPSNPCPCGAQFAEVEVDMETGEVKVLKVVVAYDVGRAINPSEGQIEGGIQQGIGYALTEELIIDEETGRVSNNRFLDYKMLTALDMPKIDVIIIETVDPPGPFHSENRSHKKRKLTGGV